MFETQQSVMEKVSVHKSPYSPKKVAPVTKAIGFKLHTDKRAKQRLDGSPSPEAKAYRENLQDSLEKRKTLQYSQSPVRANSFDGSPGKSPAGGFRRLSPLKQLQNNDSPRKPNLLNLDLKKMEDSSP